MYCVGRCAKLCNYARLLSFLCATASWLFLHTRLLKTPQNLSFNIIYCLSTFCCCQLNESLTNWPGVQQKKTKKLKDENEIELRMARDNFMKDRDLSCFVFEIKWNYWRSFWKWLWKESTNLSTVHASKYTFHSGHCLIGYVQTNLLKVPQKL